MHQNVTLQGNKIVKNIFRNKRLPLYYSKTDNYQESNTVGRHLCYENYSFIPLSDLGNCVKCYKIRFFHFSNCHQIVLTWLVSNFVLFWSPNLSMEPILSVSNVHIRKHTPTLHTAKKGLLFW